MGRRGCLLLVLVGLTSAQADAREEACSEGRAVWKAPVFCLEVPRGWRQVTRKKGTSSPVVFSLTGETRPQDPRLEVSWVATAGTTFEAQVKAAQKGVPTYMVFRDATPRLGFRVLRIDDAAGVRAVAILEAEKHIFTCRVSPGARPLEPDELAACDRLAVPAGAGGPAVAEEELSGDPSIRRRAEAEEQTALHARKRRVFIPDAWRACRRAVDCTFFWEPCLTDSHLVVNKRSSKKTKQLVADACRGLGSLGGEPDDVVPVCQAKQCALRKK